MILDYKNIDIAVIKMVNKDPHYYPANFEGFYPYVRENFDKNRESLLAFVEKKMIEYPEIELAKTGLYNMTTTIDYKRLYEYLQKIELKK
jgi:hypothetical protein